MSLYIVFLLLLLVINSKLFVKDYNKDYLSKDNTSAIKGLFILIVFASHIMQYALYNNKVDLLGRNLIINIGQLMVTMFLFYSGYGIFESLKRKKDNYMKSFFKNRIIKTWFNFVIFVVIYLIIDYVLKINYPIKTKLLSLIGFESVGNSNWYMFDIIILYFITFISYLLSKKEKNFLIINLIITFIFFIILYKIKPSWWYNTLLCYSFGMIFSYFKDAFESLFINNKKFNNFKYLIVLFISVILFIILFLYGKKIILYEVCTLLFCFIIVLFTLKININNKILIYSGKNLFFLYMTQRIPMIILSNHNYNIHVYKFFLISFISMFILSYITSKFINYTNKKCFK